MESAFLWGPNGHHLTPEQLAAMQQQAGAMSAAGSSMAPVGSTMEGLGRLAQAGAGAYMNNQAQQQTPAQQVANALANSSQPAYPGATSMDQGFDTGMAQQQGGIFGMLANRFGGA